MSLQDTTPTGPQPAAAKLRQWALLLAFWSYVLIPLAWGVKSTVQKAMLLFQ